MIKLFNYFSCNQLFTFANCLLRARGRHFNDNSTTNNTNINNSSSLISLLNAKGTQISHESKSSTCLSLSAHDSSDFGQTALTAFQAVKNVQKPLRSARKKKKTCSKIAAQAASGCCAAVSPRFFRNRWTVVTKKDYARFTELSNLGSHQY
jgi:hypothetical protein